VTARPSVGAAIDLGSTSVHLAIARIDGHDVEPLADESALLGLGSIVDATAHLGADVRSTLADTLRGYVATARELGAGTISIIGTEPLRRTADASRTVTEIERATGVPVHVLAHEEEAYLTLIGVTGGREVKREVLVVDIGGGSSEFCDVPARGRARVAGIRLGANRLTQRHVTTDPPTSSELDAMRATADSILRETLDAHPRELVLVGGTASNLLKVTADGRDDRLLDRDRLATALAVLSEAPAATVVERYVVNPIRARLLPAGAVIVGSLMDRYGVETVRVSEAGLREGTILIADHAGREWRDRLAELAHGWAA
jgi:exopolyphosphatase/guanosine-5'-triphosphate,3'-diphosphate pyrophosphatase